MSTSSSEKPWFLTWLSSAVFLLIVIGGLEYFWRWQGHKPSVVDGRDLWAYQRSQVYRNGDATVVLIGESRIQLDICTRTFRARFPNHHIIQLAVDGRPPIATLEDLSNEPKFRGIVICGLTAPALERRNHDRQQEYVEFYHKHAFSYDMYANTAVRCFIRAHLVLTDPYLNIKDVFVKLLLRSRLPEPFYLTTNADRSRCADYTRIDIKRHLKRRILRVKDYYESMPKPNPDTWFNEAIGVEKAVRKIQKRGGNVAFVRFPTTGGHFELDNTYYPRSKFWNRFAEFTNAATIHFQDVVALQTFECPDSSHLDCRDTPRFTTLLLDEFVRNGIL